MILLIISLLTILKIELKCPIKWISHFSLLCFGPKLFGGYSIQKKRMFPHCGLIGVCDFHSPKYRPSLTSLWTSGWGVYTPNGVLWRWLWLISPFCLVFLSNSLLLRRTRREAYTSELAEGLIISFVYIVHSNISMVTWACALAPQWLYAVR